MAGHIPQHFIDDLLSRIDIVDVIDRHLTLKKKGKEYWACCPFHGEKTPSFSVSQDKQFYHCFGCGVHGSAINFLMEYEHLGFVEAVEALARQAGVEVPKDEKPVDRQQQKKLTSLLDVMEAANSYYQNQLKIAPAAIDYLKKRGIDGHTAKRFAMGWAPEGWDTLYQHLHKLGVPDALLEESGLIIKRDQGGYYDRFRARIMFPIRNRKGQTIAFGGRIIGPGEPKYLNSPETPLFHKGREIYGLWEARQSNSKLDQLMMVEGYMDVISLARHGVHFATATLGTAATAEQIQLLLKASPRLTFCFDGDSAGQRAAWRALNNCLPLVSAERDLRFLFLPEGEDPDTLIQKTGPAEFMKKLEQDAMPLPDYLVDKLLTDLPPTNTSNQIQAAEQGKQLLLKMPEGVYREMTLNKLSQKVGLGPGQIMGRQHFRSWQKPKTEPDQPPLNEMALSPERAIIRLLLHYPHLAMQLPELERFSHLADPELELLLELADLLQHNPELPLGNLVEHFRHHSDAQLLSRLSASAIPGVENEKSAHMMLSDSVQRLTHQLIQQRWKALHSKVTQGLPLSDQEKTEYAQLLRQTKR